MVRLVLCVLALCAGAFVVPTSSYSDFYNNLESKVLQEREQELLLLFNHIHEPISVPKLRDIASSWRIENNFERYGNVSTAKAYVDIINYGWYLPRGMPFSVNEPVHIYEVITLFHVLYTAQDYQTFYNTAVYLRDIVNEYMYVYVINVVVLYRNDTQGMVLPPIYEIFPSFFNNGEIMVTTQKMNTHGHNFTKSYPSTYVWNDNVVIRWNDTMWPYYNKDQAVAYFTHDYTLNALYYNQHLMYPHWLGSNVIPGLKLDKHGEMLWFHHKQLLARYYLERLSNGLGEIPEISNVVKEGYVAGLLYHNGVPYPSRPNYYSLEQPELVEGMEEVIEYERRVWDAIEKGFIINDQGEHISIINEDGLDILGRLVGSHFDSPNSLYYKDFIRLWKGILGNSIQHRRHYQYHNEYVPLALPSVMEHYQTALRDPALYMMWKRVMKLFSRWQKRMPLHKLQDLACHAVSIKKVEVDKLLTYFEYSYMDVNQHLYQGVSETQGLHDGVKVLVQHPRLNHKPFNIRVHVKSDVAKTVDVKFFLAPKYDGNGYEIPPHENTENWFLFDHFMYNLTVGDSVITRESTANDYTFIKWDSGYEIYDHASKGQWIPDIKSQSIDKFPHHLLLPKGKVGGMPFQLIVYINEYRAPKIPQGTGFNPLRSLGLGTGARFATDQMLAFPADRPLYIWQIKGLQNMWIQEVLIHHKHAQEVVVPYTE